ncbi:MAG: HAD hydrolase-like protein [Chthoniobacterales bacterium]
MSDEAVTAILFDLDGTLVDSLPGIEASLQRAVAQCSPGPAVGKIRDVIGPPLPTMFARLWPELPARELGRLVATFRTDYDTDGCREARLFDGVAETLLKLAKSGVKMFILTNKRAGPTRTIVQQNAIQQYFDAVVSPDSHEPGFSTKSEGALLMRRDYMLAPERTLFVGDGVDDADAAAACGFRFVAANYGYGRVVERTKHAPYATLKAFSELEAFVL